MKKLFSLVLLVLLISLPAQPILAQPAFRSIANTVSTGTPTSRTVTKPSGTVSEDILVAFLYKENDEAVTAPSGFTLLASLDEGTDHSTYLHWKRAGGSEPADYTFSSDGC